MHVCHIEVSVHDVATRFQITVSLKHLFCQADERGKKRMVIVMPPEGGKFQKDRKIANRSADNAGWLCRC